MPWHVLADAVVVLHLGVIAFIVLGGLLALRWPRVALLHLPFAAWGFAIELGQWVCPLTPLENRFRRLAGGSGYEGGFVEHHVLPVLYPAGLGAAGGVALAALVLVVNVLVYTAVVRRGRGRAGRGLRRRPT